MHISFQCIYCKHFKEKVFCYAYPKGIPKEIILHKYEHKKPLPDQDNDIVFEPIKEK